MQQLGFLVPIGAVGTIIGRKGWHSKQIEDKNDVKIKIRHHDQYYAQIIVHGTHINCTKAQQLIHKKIYCYFQDKCSNEGCFFYHFYNHQEKQMLFKNEFVCNPKKNSVGTQNGRGVSPTTKNPSLEGKPEESNQPSTSTSLKINQHGPIVHLEHYNKKLVKEANAMITQPHGEHTYARKTVVPVTQEGEVRHNPNKVPLNRREVTQANKSQKSPMIKQCLNQNDKDENQDRKMQHDQMMPQKHPNGTMTCQVQSVTNQNQVQAVPNQILLQLSKTLQQLIQVLSV